MNCPIRSSRTNFRSASVMSRSWNTRRHSLRHNRTTYIHTFEYICTSSARRKWRRWWVTYSWRYQMLMMSQTCLVSIASSLHTHIQWHQHNAMHHINMYVYACVYTYLQTHVTDHASWTRSETWMVWVVVDAQDLCIIVSSTPCIYALHLAHHQWSCAHVPSTSTSRSAWVSHH